VVDIRYQRQRHVSLRMNSIRLSCPGCAKAVDHEMQLYLIPCRRAHEICRDCLGRLRRIPQSERKCPAGCSDWNGAMYHHQSDTPIQIDDELARAMQNAMPSMAREGIPDRTPLPEGTTISEQRRFARSGDTSSIISSARDPRLNKTVRSEVSTSSSSTTTGSTTTTTTTSVSTPEPVFPTALSHTPVPAVIPAQTTSTGVTGASAAPDGVPAYRADAVRLVTGLFSSALTSLCSDCSFRFMLNGLIHFDTQRPPVHQSCVSTIETLRNMFSLLEASSTPTHGSDQQGVVPAAGSQTVQTAAPPGPASTAASLQQAEFAVRPIPFVFGAAQQPHQWPVIVIDDDDTDDIVAASNENAQGPTPLRNVRRSVALPVDGRSRETTTAPRSAVVQQNHGVKRRTHPDARRDSWCDPSEPCRPCDTFLSLTPEQRKVRHPPGCAFTPAEVRATRQRRTSEST
jgi:hypothetical protein